MLYLYDNAIADYLRKSFNPDNVENPVVSFVNTDNVVGVAAQIQNDELKFPIVSLMRKPNSVQIDKQRMNFTRSHFGISSVIDQKTNNLYYEKVLPITLEYALTVLTTNTADRDELIRELLFKYINIYFLTIRLPYECDRKVRFGVSVSEADIDYSSGSSEYAESGSLYQAIIPLKCDGCVYVTYTPAHLVRTIQDVDAILMKQIAEDAPNLI
jgi:hypothetical protein